jgi:very-short-patch-repair endonuclease
MRDFTLGPGLWMTLGKDTATACRLSVMDALVRLGGIATRSQVLEVATEHQLRRALAAGSVIRAGRGRYALPTADRARVAAGRLGGVVSHLSAAAHWEWQTRLPPVEPDVIVPRPAATDGVQVWVRRLRASEVVDGVTSPQRTVLDCAADLPFDDALAVADSASRAGVDLAGLRPRTTRQRAVLDFADGRAANAFESALRALAREAGLSVVPQFEITVGGITYHPDLAAPLHGIVLEADSYAFHASTSAHEQDCHRYNALVIAGWRVLRFTWVQVMVHPDQVVATIREAIAGRCRCW